MATDLGKVGIVMKGDWSSSATYEALDAVSYSGATYIAKQNVPANTLPTNTTYWQVGLQAPSIESETIDISTLDVNTTGKIYIRKQFDVVSLWFYDLRSTSFSTLTAAIPEKYRPLTHVNKGAVYKGDGTYGGTIDITTGGNVNFSNLATSVYHYGTITYVR